MVPSATLELPGSCQAAKETSPVTVGLAGKPQGEIPMAKALIFNDLKKVQDCQGKMLTRIADQRAPEQERRAHFRALRTELQAQPAVGEESRHATMLACPDLREDARHSLSERREVDDNLFEQRKPRALERAASETPGDVHE
jgi:hypothetical protein